MYNNFTNGEKRFHTTETILYLELKPKVTTYIHNEFPTVNVMPGHEPLSELPASLFVGYRLTGKVTDFNKVNVTNIM